MFSLFLLIAGLGSTPSYLSAVAASSSSSSNQFLPAIFSDKDEPPGVDPSFEIIIKNMTTGETVWEGFYGEEVEEAIDIREYWRRPSDHIGCSMSNRFERPKKVQIRTVYDLLSGLLMEDWKLEGEELGGTTIWPQLRLNNIVEIDYEGNKTESGLTGRVSTEKLR